MTMRFGRTSIDASVEWIVDSSVDWTKPRLFVKD